jgi:hypothetical protein
MKTPVSGVVTENGAPSPKEEVYLRYYDGSGWSTYATTVTDDNGYYRFPQAPILTGDQEYYVRWDNSFDNPNRLTLFLCNVVTVASSLSANTCNFDLKDVTMALPVDGASVSLPRTFTWTPRGFGDDSYEYNLFEIGGEASYWTYPGLGYVDNYRLTNRPAGFSTGIPYGWYMGVYTPYGWGESYYYRVVTFSGSSAGPRISGRVTMNGNSASGVSLVLRYYDGSTWWNHATTSTSSDGNYSFSNLPLLSSGQVVYVRWDNVSYNDNRLWTWRCYQISNDSYSREYTCNFDLKNIPLVSPLDESVVSLPTTFTWTARGFSGESYLFELFDLNYAEPYFASSLLGNVEGYDLTSLPVGFTTGIQYGWGVLTYTDYDGYGSSYYYSRVTFTGSDTAVTPIIQPKPGPTSWQIDDPIDRSRPKP